MNKKRGLVLLVVVLAGLGLIGWEVAALTKEAGFSEEIVVWDGDETLDFYYRFNYEKSVWEYRVFDTEEKGYKCDYTQVGAVCGNFDPVMVNLWDGYAELDNKLVSAATLDEGAAVFCTYALDNNWGLFIENKNVEISASKCESDLVSLAGAGREAEGAEKETPLSAEQREELSYKPSQKEKEIDEVWQKISAALGLSRKGQVWAPSEEAGGRWLNYETVYLPETPQAAAKISYTGTEATPEMKALLDVIAWAEGADYNTLVGGGTFTNFSAHPVDTGEISKKGICIKKWNVCSTAAGRYQFIYGTYNDLKRKGYFSTGFGAEEQDKAAIYLVVTKRGVSQEEIKGAVEDNTKWGALFGRLAWVWASFPCISKGLETSCYGQGGKSKEQLIKKFNEFYPRYKQG